MEKPRWSFVSGPRVAVLDNEEETGVDAALQGEGKGRDLAAENSAGPGRVLLASTDPREVRRLRSILSAEAWEFSSAAGGEEALREISEAGTTAPASPHVILLGLPLSGPYGRLIIESVRGADPAVACSILALTREDTPGEVRQALEAGADQAVRRPLDADDLLSRVRILMQLQQISLAERAARSVREAAEEELAAARTQRVAFAGKVSHDLKNPLTGIMGHAQMLQMKFGSSQPDVEGSATKILRSAHQLQLLLTDLRDLGLLESGRLRMDIDRIDLHATLVMVLDEVRAEAEASGVTLELVPSRPDSRCGNTLVQADTGLLIRLLSSLISNAVRHSPPEGRVRIVVGSPADGRAEVHISDIADEVHDFAAGIFRNAGGIRGGADGPSRLEGGLRMSFCRAVVDAHGGRLWVRPNAAGGSTIGLLLPAERGSVE